ALPAAGGRAPSAGDPGRHERATARSRGGYGVGRRDGGADHGQRGAPGGGRGVQGGGGAAADLAARTGNWREGILHPPRRAALGGGGGGGGAGSRRTRTTGGCGDRSRAARGSAGSRTVTRCSSAPRADGK